MDNAQSLAILLATPAGVAVVGALLWWRVGNTEREVRELRTMRHDVNNSLAKLQGTVSSLENIVIQVLSANRKGKA